MLNFDHAFIVTYGRSGSTLLQGVLNTIPGAEIRGENGNALFVLFQAARHLRITSPHAKNANDPTHPWYGAHLIDHEMFEAELVAAFKGNVMAGSEHNLLRGFKEIRYQTMTRDQLWDYLAFLRQYFPRTAFIMNTRDLDEVIASNARAKHMIGEAELRHADQNFRDYAAEFPDHAYHTHYDDFTADPLVLRGLFDFLGARMDEDAVAKVMGRTHSMRTR